LAEEGGAVSNLWPPDMSFEHEAGRLRRLAKDHRTLTFYTAHAEVERKKDDISKLDIAHMLGRCLVSLVEVNKKNGEEEWRAEGSDNDGRKITAVVVIYEDAKEIKVIAAWANEKT
jgi:hypothetical protein